jgi:uncharacterized spore protein YtfJ
MEIHELLAKANDSIHVARVFGAPIERDGALIVPVAAVQGGGGGGGGTGTGPDGAGEGSGSGGGFAVRARPVGVFEVRDGRVRWVPAIDAVRVARAAAAVAVVALVSWSSAAWARSLARAARGG